MDIILLNNLRSHSFKRDSYQYSFNIDNRKIYRYTCKNCGLIAFGTIDKPTIYDSMSFYYSYELRLMSRNIKRPSFEETMLSCDEMIIKDIIE